MFIKSCITLLLVCFMLFSGTNVFGNTVTVSVSIPETTTITVPTSASQASSSLEVNLESNSSWSLVDQNGFSFESSNKKVVKIDNLNLKANSSYTYTVL